MSVDLSKLSADEKRALLADLLKRKADAAGSKEYPLSHGQRALWFEHTLDPGSSAYNIAVALRVRSRVDVTAFRRAWAAVVEHHASLRATFPVIDGHPRQVIASCDDLPWSQFDCAGMGEDELLARILTEHRRPFVLETGPVFRIALFTLRDDLHVVLFSVHHIAADGWSLRLVLEDFTYAYAAEAAGTPASLPARAASYRDFVGWQAQHLETDGARLEEYWTSTLSGELPILAMSRRSRPAVQRIDGAIHPFSVPGHLSEAINAFARKSGVTPFSVLLAGFVAVLSRHSGQSDIVVGTPALGRPRTEFERVVGYFVNPLALRTRLDDDPLFETLVRRVQDTVQQGLSHQDYPFPLLVEKLRPTRDLRHTLIFQVMFNLLRLPQAPTQEGAEAVFEPYLLPQEEGQFALALEMVEIGSRLVAAFRYDRDLFDAREIGRISERLLVLLEAAIGSPGTAVSLLPLLPEKERADVVEGFNRTARELPAAQTAATLFEQVAARSPESIAVKDATRTLAYGTLDAAANRFAHHLRANGVGRGALVGVSLSRTVDMVVALLGVMKAGAGYVPLDPAYPLSRLQFMAEDADIRLVVTEDAHADLWRRASSAQQVLIDAHAAEIATQSALVPVSVHCDTDVAYVIYTSGSTGRPKGVEIQHRALVNFLTAMLERPGVTADDRLLAVTTLSFDIAGLELFAPLVAGGTVVVASREDTLDGRRLIGLLDAEAITILQATPATWRLLLAAGWRGSPHLKMLCGGEAMPPGLADDLLPCGKELWNMYGPTETTIWSTVDRVQPDAAITIGRPIANTQCYVLDGHGEPVGIGMVGELCIGGEGLARGYRAQPDLTAEKFVRDPFGASSTARMYRTGDLASFREDGRLDCFGRIDHNQVKVRGYRIELGEVESVLERHPAIRRAVAAVPPAQGGDGRLVAYVVFAPGQDLTSSELRKFSRAELPEVHGPVDVRADRECAADRQRQDRSWRPAESVRLTAAGGGGGPATDAVGTAGG